MYKQNIIQSRPPVCHHLLAGHCMRYLSLTLCCYEVFCGDPQHCYIFKSLFKTHRCCQRWDGTFRQLCALNVSSKILYRLQIILLTVLSKRRFFIRVHSYRVLCLPITRVLDADSASNTRVIRTREALWAYPKIIFWLVLKCRKLGT